MLKYTTLLIVGLLLFLLASVSYATVVDQALDKSEEKISTLPIGETTKDQAGELHEFILKPLVKTMAGKIEKTVQEHPNESKKLKEDFQMLKQKVENKLRGKINEKDAKQYIKHKQDQAIAKIRSNLGL